MIRGDGVRGGHDHLLRANMDSKTEERFYSTQGVKMIPHGVTVITKSLDNLEL